MNNMKNIQHEFLGGMYGKENFFWNRFDTIRNTVWITSVWYDKRIDS